MPRRLEKPSAGLFLILWFQPKRGQQTALRAAQFSNAAERIKFHLAILKDGIKRMVNHNQDVHAEHSNEELQKLNR